MFVYEIDDCLFQSFDRAKAHALALAEEWYVEVIADSSDPSEWQRKWAASREEIASWAEDQGHYWEASPFYVSITKREVR